ncbi:LacI family DNA-binding transcriptional regulator [Pantoea sp. Eser]|nr:LacI family DNA-binding transcriptional regulator [Pantoea sp. Eser]
MATIQEVAARAGVSKATVSRVLSGNGYVGQEKRERVLQAIAETDYRPNLLARNLATKSSQTIGLVITNTLYSGSYFTELMAHSARMLEQQGRQLILADGKHTAEQEQAAIQFLLDLRCDGIIIYPRFISIDALDAIISQHRQPILVINHRLRVNDSYCIYIDQQATSAAAVSQLLARGHREIAFITGSLDSPTGMERLSGYQAALKDAKIAPEPQRIVQGKWTAQSGMAAVDSLLACKVAFTAIVASNDEMAIGAIKRLTECGIAVPQQMSVLGFDDIPLAPYITPSLSSIKLPVTEMINETIGRLVTMLDGGEWRPRLPFHGSLILRDSVADGPAA